MDLGYLLVRPAPLAPALTPPPDIYIRSLAFASTLLFAGRIADLYPPHRVYTFGFIGIAVFYLIISFMTDQYAFFVLRAISGLLAVMTIPSSINMIGEFFFIRDNIDNDIDAPSPVQMYPEPNEQAKKLALFGVAGALANTIALVSRALSSLESNPADWRKRSWLASSYSRLGDGTFASLVSSSRKTL